jgi:DNA-binding NtrC family response regulator
MAQKLLNYIAIFEMLHSGGKVMMNQARVLVVDDLPFVRQALSEWLRSRRFHVLEAEDGRQALERIRRDAPDIVISDMIMPGMDGLELLKKARAFKADLPFLIVTGYPSHDAAVKIMKQGASDYLVKPFKPEELTRRVCSRLLDNSLNKPHASVKGIILGASLSAALWVLIVGAISAFFS